MNTAELITPPSPPSAGQVRRTTRDARPPHSESPTVREMVNELLPLIDVVAVSGPPVIFVLGPWALLVLVLIGPFLLLISLALAAVVLVVATAAILAPPYLLVRHIRKHRARGPGRRSLVHLLRERRPIRVAHR
jgi:hypothetical protein